jgi:acyl carrier protein
LSVKFLSELCRIHNLPGQQKGVAISQGKFFKQLIRHDSADIDVAFIWYRCCIYKKVSATTLQETTEEGALMQAVHANTIQSWLTTHLAEQLGLSPENIDIRRPFTEYGLDSMIGVFLAGDLEDWLGLRLSATVLWEYPTTELLAQYLATELQRQGTEVKASQHASQLNLGDLALDPQEAEELLASLDGLSDAEVDRLLNDLLATPCLAA